MISRWFFRPGASIEPETANQASHFILSEMCDLATLGPLALAMNRNAIMAAKRANARLGPAVAAPRRLTGAIEQSCDLLVGHLARQLPDQGQRVLGNGPAMLTNTGQLELQRCVIAALPMQHHFDEAVLDAHDDLMQCRA